MSGSIDSDRVRLLPRPDVHPLQSFGTETAVNTNEYIEHGRPQKRVSFDPYDQAHFQHEEKGRNRSLYTPSMSPFSSHRLDLWTTALMCCLLLIGIGCGVAHHAFNSYLDGKATSSFDQAWAIRIGTGLALAFKTAVLASMGMAFAQRMWRSVRQEALSVKSLDALFGAFGGDPRSLFQGDLYRSARLALLLAVAGWVLPIATVFTPATLRVKPVDRSSSTDCIVPNINLNNISDGGNIRYPSSGGDYVGPAPVAQRFAVQSLITGSFVQFPYTSDHPIGTNTSYVLSFTAPALSCSANNSTVQSSLSNNTYWTGARSVIHDSSSGLDVPIIQIQYSSTPGSNNPTALSCAPYLAIYGVSISYNSTTQSVALLNMSMTAPAGRPAGGGIIQMSDANALTTGAAAIIDAVYNTLTGTISQGQNGNAPSSASHVALASFVHTSNQSAYTFDSVSEKIEQLIRDVSLSLMGLRLNTAQTICTTIDQANIYVYDQGDLLIAYLAAAAAAVAGVGVGLHALKKNGHAEDTSFSGVVLSTRNPTLDRACEGGRDRLLALRVKLGRLPSTGRPAFGTASDFSYSES